VKIGKNYFNMKSFDLENMKTWLRGNLQNYYVLFATRIL
jgi:hypothetical protein